VAFYSFHSPAGEQVIFFTMGILTFAASRCGCPRL